MRLTTSAGIALVAGALGTTGVANAFHGENGASEASLRIGGGDVRVTVSLGGGSVRKALHAGTLTIDGRCYTIDDCDPEREIARAFRRAGYCATDRHGRIVVDYRRYPPRICWESRDYELIVKESSCSELTLTLVEICSKRGGTPAVHVHERDVRRIDDDRRAWDDRRDRDHDRRGRADGGRGRDDDRRRGGWNGRDGDRDAAPQPYRRSALSSTSQRPRLIGAWVPEPPKVEDGKD